MRRVSFVRISCFSVLLFVTVTVVAEDPFRPAEFYATYCAACHGVDMKGANAGSLIDDTFLYGRTEQKHRGNILYGIKGTDMIGWKHLLSNGEARELVD